MKTIKVYTPAELKELFPDAFEKAHERYIQSDYEIPWSEDTIESMKAVFKAAGLALRDYSIDGYNPGNSGLKVDIETATGELAGQRAIAWLENNLFWALRTPWGIGKIKDRVRYHHPAGSIPECPLTGYCADDDYLDALTKEILEGSTIKEAFRRLAYVAGKILEGEIEYTQTEEYFIENEWMEYTAEGKAI